MGNLKPKNSDYQKNKFLIDLTKNSHTVKMGNESCCPTREVKSEAPLSQLNQGTWYSLLAINPPNADHLCPRFTTIYDGVGQTSIYDKASRRTMSWHGYGTLMD